MPLIQQALTMIALVMLYNRIRVSYFVVVVFLAILKELLQWHAGPLWETIGMSEPASIVGFMWSILLGLMLPSAYSQHNISLDAVTLIALSLFNWSVGIRFVAINGKWSHPIWWPFYLLFGSFIPIFIFATFPFQDIFGFDSGAPFLFQQAPTINTDDPVFLLISTILAGLFLIWTQIDWLYILPRLKLILREARMLRINLLRFIFAASQYPNLMPFGLFIILPIMILPIALVLGFLGIIFSLIVNIPPIVGLFIIMILLLLLVALILMYPYYIFLDIKKYRTWRTGTSLLNILQLVDAIEKQKIAPFRWLMIQRAKERQRIIPIAQNEFHLRNLISFLDSYFKYANKDDQYLYLSNLDPILSKHMRKHSKLESFFFSSWTARELDSLVRLLEQIQSARLSK